MGGVAVGRGARPKVDVCGRTVKMREGRKINRQIFFPLCLMLNCGCVNGKRGEGEANPTQKQMVSY